MTSVSLMRRRTVLATLTTPLWLAACGKGGGGGSGLLRAINLTDDLASADLYLSGTDKIFSGLTTGVLTSYTSVDSNTYSLNINSAGSTTSLFTGSYTIAKNDHYTAVIWGPQASLRVTTLPEDDDTTLIGTGNTRVRIFNATETTGTLDVYLTTLGADLASSTATQAGVPGGGLSGFHEIPAGTYELRVTAAGSVDPGQIRLDIPAVTFAATQYATIVLTAGTGGALVNATVIVEQGSATSTPNVQARVRVVSSVDNLGTVTATVNDATFGVQTLTTNLVSSVSTYQLINVASGTSATYSIQINGNPAFTNASLSVTAGGDYTLLVWGSAANPQQVLLVDNNNLPTSTTQTKMRLVNGVDNLNSLSLLVNQSPYLQGVAPGQQSSFYALVPSSTTAYVEVDDATSATPIFSSSVNQPFGVNLVAQGVYSVFVLSGQVNASTGANQPKTLLFKEN